MSPTTAHTRRARSPRERRHPRPLALASERRRTDRLGRGLARRRPLPARGRARPRPRRLLPPLRLRGVNSKEERTMLRSNHTTQSHNLAARMGRWSAAHWKTATFGWLAFVVVAFALGGMVGTKSIDPNTAGPGRVGPHGPDPRGRLQAAGRRERPDPEPLGSRRRRRLRRRRSRDVVARVSKVADVQNVRSPLAPGNADQISKDGHSALVEFDIRGDKDKAVDKIAPGPRQRRRRATRPSGLRHRRVRRRERAEGRRDGVRRRPRQGRDALASDHADHPRAHVRRARGGRHSAAARADRRLRDVRADRAARATCCRSRCEAPAMVLLIGLAVGVDYSMFYLKRERQERAAGRSEQAALEVAAATSGRSVLISGLTVMVAMAGMFLTGDTTFASLAARHDPRRRRRGARVADRASGAALAARRQGRPGARPARRPAPPRRRRRADLGRDRRPRPAPAGALGGPRRRAAAGARRARVAAAPRGSGARVVPEVARGHQDVRPDAAGVSRHGASGQRRRQGAERERAGDAQGDRRARAAGARQRPRVRADHRRPSTRKARSRTSPSRSPGTEPTPPRTPPSACCARRSSPRPSARFRTRRPASPGRRPSGGTRPTS